MSTEYENESLNDSQVNITDVSERTNESFDNAEVLYPEEDSSSSSEEN